MAEDMVSLRERLKAAEDVCLMYGWTGSGETTPREKALFVLWARWADLVGGEFTSPSTHPHLGEWRIAELAAERDRRRAAVAAASAALKAASE